MCFARLLSPSLGLFGRLHHPPKPDTPPPPPPPPPPHTRATYLAMRHSQPSLGVPRSPSTAPPCFSSSPKRSILPFFGRAAFTDMMPGYMHTQATSYTPHPPSQETPHPPPPPPKKGETGTHRASCSASFTTITWCTSLAIVQSPPPPPQKKWCPSPPPLSPKRSILPFLPQFLQT